MLYQLSYASIPFMLRGALKRVQVCIRFRGWPWRNSGVN
jgi:hypothetical protein